MEIKLTNIERVSLQAAIKLDKNMAYDLLAKKLLELIKKEMEG